MPARRPRAHFVGGILGCRLMLIGDCAQLPPRRGTGKSGTSGRRSGTEWDYAPTPATSTRCSDRERDLAFSSMRRLSHILSIRDTATLLPRIRVKGFADVAVVPGDEPYRDTLLVLLSEVGTDETMGHHAEQQAGQYLQSRHTTHGARLRGELSTATSSPLCTNKYLSGEQQKLMPLLANGDRARIPRVHNTRELYGFHFADITISMLDYNDVEIDTTAILDTLTSDAPALTREQDAALFQQVMEELRTCPAKPTDASTARTTTTTRDQVWLRRHLPQGTGRAVGACVYRPRLHDRRNALCRLPPLALYGLHTRHGATLPRQLAQEATFGR